MGGQVHNSKVVKGPLNKTSEQDPIAARYQGGQG